MQVRCGEETRVVPRILQMRAHWMKSQKESMRLEEAGLSGDVLDAALSSFILEVGKTKQVFKFEQKLTHLKNPLGKVFDLNLGKMLKQS